MSTYLLRTYLLAAIAEMKPGDHLCWLYESEEEHRALLTPFLRQGLERGEKVLYIADTHTADAVLSYLRDDGLEIEPLLARGQLSILTADTTYLRDGTFNPDAMIAFLGTQTEHALTEGYAALRVTSEMSWLHRRLPGSKRLIEYESELNAFLPGSHCLSMCQYDRRRFDPAVLLDVLATHPIAIVGTEIYDNFYYVAPADFLGPDRPEATLHHWLENLAEHKRTEEELRKSRDALAAVPERTAELVRKNEALQAEIAERKRTETDLQEGAERLQLILANSPDNIFYQDRDLRYTWVVNALPPFSKEQMLGKTDFDLFTAEEAQRLTEIQKKVLQTGVGTKVEVRLVLGGTAHYFDAIYQPQRDKAGNIVGLFGYVNDITNIKQAEDGLKQSLERLRTTVQEVVEAMAMTVEMRDPYTAGHQRRVAKLAAAIAREMSLSEDRVHEIEMAADIHDIGKIYAPAEFLTKPNRLSEIEFDLIKTHPEIGHDILKGIQFPWPVAQIVLQHHERLNGSGYPLGLKGEEIMLEARIIAVADVVEAMGTHRPYRPALGIEKALDEISRNKGILYDPQVVEACKTIFAQTGMWE